jgi:hypothetical protein
MRITASLAMASLLAASGCGIAVLGTGIPVTGSGVTRQETRELADFHGVDVSAAFEATVKLGPKPSVTLDVDDNLLPLIKTDVIDGRLVVRYAEGHNVRTNKPQKLTIVAPSLDYVGARGATRIVATVGEGKSMKVEASGASSIRVEGLAADSIVVKAEGSSQVTLSGRGKKLTLGASGASKVLAGGIAFESARVDLSGACQGDLHVTASIDVDLSGASSLKVKGDPKARTVNTSGASSVSF